jgi:hypothetical protein
MCGGAQADTAYQAYYISATNNAIDIRSYGAVSSYYVPVGAYDGPGLALAIRQTLGEAFYVQWTPRTGVFTWSEVHACSSTPLYAALTHTGPHVATSIWSTLAISTGVDRTETPIGPPPCNYSGMGFSSDVSTRPFGSIDIPTPNQTVSGTIQQWGWILTPAPGSIVVNDPDMVKLFVDGYPLPMPGSSIAFVTITCGYIRTDVAAAYPGYPNSGAAGCLAILDSTRLTNGSHNLSWYATDAAGRLLVMSRTFNVLN